MKTHSVMFSFQNEGIKQKTNLNPNTKNNQPILLRISKLQDNHLKTVDIDLFRHIKMQEVLLKPFLLRWIRCLFTRVSIFNQQFQIKQHLMIWDNILLHEYQQQNGMFFVECMVLAMLSYLREIALSKEQSYMTTQLYQKYPPLQEQQLREIVGLAWKFNQILKNNQVEIKKQEKNIFLFNKGYTEKVENKNKTINEFKIDNKLIKTIKEVKIDDKLIKKIEEEEFPYFKKDKQNQIKQNINSLMLIKQEKEQNYQKQNSEQIKPVVKEINFTFSEIEQIKNWLNQIDKKQYYLKRQNNPYIENILNMIKSKINDKIKSQPINKIENKAKKIFCFSKK